MALGNVEGCVLFMPWVFVLLKTVKVVHTSFMNYLFPLLSGMPKRRQKANRGDWKLWVTPGL